MFSQRHLKDGTIGPSKFSTRNYKYGFETFQSQPICTASTGYGNPTATTGATNLMLTGTYPNVITWEYFILGAGQTIIAPIHGTAGLGVELDKTDNEGAEYCPGGNTTRSRFAFTIGTDPTFFARLKFTQSDVSGTDECLFGFRKQAQASQTVHTSYTDYAFIGQVAAAGAIVTKTRLNTGTASSVSTTNTAWADGETHTYGVEVSSAGAVRFTYDGLFPTVTQAFTFDTGDVVIPVFYYLHATTTPQDVDLVEFECGYRPLRYK